MSVNSLAMGAAASDGMLEYNGFRFPKGLQTLDFYGVPRWDSTGRTIVYTEFFLKILAWLNISTRNNPISNQPMVQNALSLLTQPCGSLVYTGRFGEFRVNAGGRVSDVENGPVPDVVQLETRGPGVTTKIVWAVKWKQPTCNDARFSGPLEFCYGTDIDVAALGLTKRVYSGFIRIASNRGGPRDRKVLRSAEEWKDKVVPPLLVGFRRTDRTFKVSHDKCRLDFSITDEEFPSENMPPPEVAIVDAGHNFTNSQAGKIYMWTGHLWAKYTVAKSNGLGVFESVKAFLALAEDRLAALRKAGAAGAGPSPALGKFAVIPLTFSVAEPSIYGDQQVHLDMRYTVAAASLKNILNLGGLWRPVPGQPDPSAAWEKWATSVRVMLGPRGGAGLLGYRPGEEEIVDLCARIPADPPKKPSRGPGRGGPAKPKPRQPLPLGGGTLIFDGKVFEAPTAVKSWIAYKPTVRIETDSGVVVGTTLPTAPIEPASASSPWNAANGLPAAAGDKLIAPQEDWPRSPGSAGEHFVHRRTNPRIWVIFEGVAFRAGYPIPTPELLRVGNVDLIPCNREGMEGFQTAIVAQGGLDGTIPIHGAAWRFRYLLPERPKTGGTPVVPNPGVA